MTKSERLLKILELISKYDISTQSELVEKLNSEGYQVTQATTSRDLNELRIVKVQNGSGTYKYAAPSELEIKINDKMHNMFSQCILSVEHAMNIVVIKTITGAAQAAAYALDSFTWDEIIGSIAGDDTVMVVVRNEKSARQLEAKLIKYKVE